jgi:hypothetical protein
MEVTMGRTFLSDLAEFFFFLGGMFLFLFVYPLLLLGLGG